MAGDDGRRSIAPTTTGDGAGVPTSRGRVNRLVLGMGAIAAVLVAGAALLTARGAIGERGPVAALGPPRFVEEAAAAGIDHAYQGEFTYFVGGGVAVFDCDEDGRQDLYLAGGAGPAALYRNDSAVGGPLRFSAIPDAAATLSQVIGAYPLDIDGDKNADLAVLRLGENVILRGLGGCRFERANEALGLDGGSAWTGAFSAMWEGSAALPTLAFGNYAELDATGEWTGSCTPNSLLRPGQSGVRYRQPTSLAPGWCTLSILFSDWDRSGRRDLRVSNDRHYYGDYSDGEEQLWRIAPGEPPRLYTHAEGWQTVRIWGMGIASQDLTGDGYPEVFLTSQGDNKLQTLAGAQGEPRYSDIALRRGVTAHRPFAGGDTLPSTAWHAEFQDVNNDGFVDLFVAKGNVEAQTETAAKDPSNLLVANSDGTFTEAAEAAGILSYARGRGAALADFNLDGLLDLVEVARRENVKLWRNVGRGTAEQPAPMGNWVAIRLSQDAPNPDAIGALVEVKVGDRTIEREVTVGGGHAGGQLGWIHFGLGSADGAEVRVLWPNGETGPWLRVPPNRFVVLERGATEPRGWRPPSN
jgi:hypothetical protein